MTAKNYDEAVNTLVEEMMNERRVPEVEKLMEKSDEEVATEIIVVSFLTSPDKIDVQHEEDLTKLEYKIVRAIQEFLTRQPDTDLAVFQSVGIKQSPLRFRVTVQALDGMFS